MQKITFLYNSITDSQNVIKALDTKLGFLIVGLSLPFTNLGKIINHIVIFLDTKNSCIYYFFLLVTILFVISWLTAFFICIKGVIAIGNPARNVINDASGCGSFFNGDLYKFNFGDIFIK